MKILKLFILGLLVMGLSHCSDQVTKKQKNLNELQSALTDLNSEMEYVELCKAPGDCKKFSRLVMGTDHLIQANWTGRGEPDKSDEEAFAVLDEAARLGINFFDTSPIYVGSVEYKLGQWINSRKDTVKEDSFYYNSVNNPDRNIYSLSKGGFPFDLFYSRKLEAGTHSSEFQELLKSENVLDQDPQVQADGSISLGDVPAGTYASRLYGSEEQIVSRVSEEMGHSLRNLNNDITIYLMHRDDNDYYKFQEVSREQTSVSTIMSALSNDAIASQHWMLGWSNWQTERVNESIDLADNDSQLSRPVINSPYFSLFEMSDRSIHAGGVQVFHEEMIDPNFQKGINIMPYSPLGRFSIFDKDEPIWENAKAAAFEKYQAGDPYWQNVYNAIFTEENRLRYERVVEFTKTFNQEHDTDYTLDQMINAYALAHERVTFLAVGPINVEQLRRTVASLKLAKLLSAADLDYLHSGR